MVLKDVVKKDVWDLDRNCDLKQGLFRENVKCRAQELATLADTTRILNDNGRALELFKHEMKEG